MGNDNHRLRSNGRFGLEPQGISALLLGIFILVLALIVWWTTRNLLGWAALYLPGAFYTFRGLYTVTEE